MSAADRAPSAIVVAALAISGLLVACGGSTEPAASVAATDNEGAISTETVADSPDTAPTSETPAPTTEIPTPTSTEAAPPPTSTAALDPEPPTPPRPFRAMTLAETEQSSNPLLAWDAVDGAVLYRLVVLDPDGQPYWAWSGSATSVYLGGNEAETTVGARLFAEMTWQVSAHDAAGIPIAFSDLGVASP